MDHYTDELIDIPASDGAPRKVRFWGNGFVSIHRTGETGTEKPAFVCLTKEQARWLARAILNQDHLIDPDKEKEQ